ncbi:MAG: 50S ribosomal protein L19 [Verrucomicrobia bacterium CG_4_10_14_3_um_filter_43_23]|nr:MAG: 50S ribosomal protein L19 [Verrucomicrobia bacterium CG1_02_43_26]PIP59160.1 MAG: 50S ribosomal protein L19 [Verrucomicrobia bacterium CG22_combo_CG10-13_8_21_14_all_43_17]PIX58029.1 MAG: 50S ribosomal protein L19 [Verrucomicrobia bacterium CG_4_10_14_3_um_filter_43_23]PIY62264.1 MAG: 50S ribosomal protein L19 [Verrucomicrobia bacterium CG_4_10_14_0_8_um_filter_43_34]PJA43766.1 MAG: 50S ribosomal protein L19 [Verrucomicrobia bacterium CG_4_9_14_3_um_filter_43_20]
MNQIIENITKEQLRPENTNFKIGDGVRVHLRIREGDKERVQIFSGIVIARKGGGIEESFTVRRYHQGEGVERVFPVHSPSIVKVEVDRESVVMRAKMYWLRTRIGKEANKVKEQRYARKG